MLVTSDESVQWVRFNAITWKQDDRHNLPTCSLESRSTPKFFIKSVALINASTNDIYLTCYMVLSLAAGGNRSADFAGLRHGRRAGIRHLTSTLPPGHCVEDRRKRLVKWLQTCHPNRGNHTKSTNVWWLFYCPFRRDHDEVILYTATLQLFFIVSTVQINLPSKCLKLYPLQPSNKFKTFI